MGYSRNKKNHFPTFPGMPPRFRRFRRRSRRSRYGGGARRRRRYSSGGLTSSLARRRVMSTRPFGRSAGTLAPRKMYTKLENIHYFIPPATPNALNSGSTCLITGWPMLPWYQGTNNGFNAVGQAYTRSSATTEYPLGWQNYYGLYKQFVVTGVKYHVQFFGRVPAQADTATTGLCPVTACTVLPVPQDPNSPADTASGSMYPSSAGAAQTAPNARTAHLRATTYGSSSQSVSFKGYLPMSVLQGQDVYDDRFYQNTYVQGQAQSSASSAALSGLAMYWTGPILTGSPTMYAPAIRVSLRWYITFFDLRMFNTTT